ncbi:MAG: GntR family transcriptional regulator [Planctomycetaceae bacterium]|nr:GntR family transcriptional regulator [Planctomycetaceae bacterium]
MAGPMQIKRPDSLSKIAENHIRQSIIRGDFQLGESLPEAKLSTAMGISKTPIREALAALKLQGLVQILPQRGAFVFTLSRDAVLQLCQYRLILETAALDLALSHDPSAFLDELEHVLAKMSDAREAGAFEQYLDLDADFHDTFFGHCGNTYLQEGYQKVGDIVGTMRTHLSKRPNRTAKSFAEHKAILNLLQEGKVKAAKTVLKRQITRGERSYSDFLGVEQP